MACQTCQLCKCAHVLRQWVTGSLHGDQSCRAVNRGRAQASHSGSGTKRPWRNMLLFLAIQNLHTHILSKWSIIHITLYFKMFLFTGSWLIIFSLTHLVHYHLHMYSFLTHKVYSRLVSSVTRTGSKSATIMTWRNCLQKMNLSRTCLYSTYPTFYLWIKMLSQILYLFAYAYIFFVYTWLFSMLTPNSHVQLMTQMMANICQTRAKVSIYTNLFYHVPQNRKESK